MEYSNLHARRPAHGGNRIGNGAAGAAYTTGESTYRESRYRTQGTPAEMALDWARQHPWMCAAAVAAVVAIGPRRLLRTAVTGGGALTALTLRNPSNIDALTRLINTVGAYLQQNSARQQGDRTRYRP